LHLVWCSIALKPLSQLIFAQITCGQSPELQNPFLFAGSELQTIQPQKGDGYRERGSLIAIHKSVIRYDALCISRSQLAERNRIFRIGEQISGPCKRRFQESAVSHSFRPTMLSQTLIVHGQNHILTHPDWLTHSASLRNTSRFSRITSRATSI